jgi:hypothetical protein
MGETARLKTSRLTAWCFFFCREGGDWRGMNNSPESRAERATPLNGKCFRNGSGDNNEAAT